MSGYMIEGPQSSIEILIWEVLYNAFAWLALDIGIEMEKHLESFGSTSLGLLDILFW